MYEGLVGLPHEMLEEGAVVKNTFIDFPAATLRTPSLDEYYKQREIKSEPPADPDDRKDTFAFQAAPIPEGADTSSSTDSGDVYDLADLDQNDTSESDEPIPISLAQTIVGLPPAPVVFSMGSQMHPNCRPCGFVHKPEGCQNGTACQYCHLCPPGEIKERKKTKIMVRKMNQYAAQAQRQAQRVSGAFWGV